MPPGDRFGVFVDLTAQNFGARSARKNAFARCKEISQASERIEIGPRSLIARLVEYLFGRHVTRRSGDKPVGKFFRAEGFCDAEIGEHCARVILFAHEQNIARFYVAVNDVARMRMRQRVEKLEQQIAHLKPRQRLFGPRQRAARREFHGIVGAFERDVSVGCGAERFVGYAVVDQSDDRRVMQTRNGAHFVEKRLTEFVLIAECRENLDGNRNRLRPMDSFPNDAHRTFADGFD